MNNWDDYTTFTFNTLELTVVFGIFFDFKDVDERRLVRATRELADVSHQIVHARWTPVEKVCSQFDVVVEQLQLIVTIEV